MPARSGKKAQEKEVAPSPPRGPVLLAGEAQSNESEAAILACNDFLRIGPGRTLSVLAARYAAMDLPAPSGTSVHPLAPSNLPPTTSRDTLKSWADRYNWSARAGAFDAVEDERKTIQRTRVLEEGKAQDFERVDALKRLANLLEDQVFEQGVAEGKQIDCICPECGMTITIRNRDLARPYHNVWLKDVKAVGGGEDVQVIDLEKFNAPLISEYRSTLDDLAKETGARHKNTQLDHLLKTIHSKIDLTKLSSEMMDALQNGEHWLTVLTKQYLRDE